MQTLFELHGATRRLSDKFALRNVNIALQPGEIVGFVGANGAGKTTVIRALLGLLHLDAGQVRLFGEPFGADAPAETQRRLRGRIGVVFDTCPFPAELTVKQAIACVSPAYPSWDAALFASLLDEFGIAAKTKIRDLSRGMGMKLQLAVALSHSADLLILDEATAGLDPVARDEILDRLRGFASDGSRGVLLSSHITSDLERVADRVVGIDAGRIMFNLPREEITDTLGIAHCTAEQAREVFAVLAEADACEPPDSPLSAFGISMPRAIRQPYSTDVLVPDRFAFVQAFPEIACDRVGVEDYLQFALKGKAEL